MREEELHTRLIEGIKDMLSEYLVRKEAHVQKKLTDEKEEQVRIEGIEEIRQIMLEKLNISVVTEQIESLKLTC